MSMNTSVKSLEKKYVRRIVASLYNMGCQKEDVDLLLGGKLRDLEDMIDFEEIFY